MDEESGARDVRAVVGGLRERLADAGIEDPAADAELIVGHVLGVSRGRVQALAVLGGVVAPDELAAILALADERARRVPLQHLTGRAPFRRIELSVGPGVFVPRPETEGVAQLAIDELLAGAEPEPLVVDLCTGSGAIALAIASEVPAARVWAVEKSREAHAWAARNIAEWGGGRVELLLGDVAELGPGAGAAGAPGAASGPGASDGSGAAGGPGASDGSGAMGEPDASGGPGIAGSPLAAALAPLEGRVAVLVSNPPYVPEGMVPRDPEVRDHDPALALYSGVDGLDLIRVISRIGLGLVRPGGLLVLEHAEHQGRAIRELLAADGWVSAATHPDLTGRDRATTARR